MTRSVWKKTRANIADPSTNTAALHDTRIALIPENKTKKKKKKEEPTAAVFANRFELSDATGL
jgi:hypothetical protein